jgi:hypothetical protein
MDKENCMIMYDIIVIEAMHASSPIPRVQSTENGEPVTASYIPNIPLACVHL